MKRYQSGTKHHSNAKKYHSDAQRQPDTQHQPNFDGVFAWVEGIASPPMPFSKGRWIQMAWPWICAAAIAGISFELAKFFILEARRRVYNHNRNLIYAAKQQQRKFPRKNQLWRTKSLNKTKPQGRERWKVPLPVPPNFIEDLSDQWSRVRDSLEDMLKFGEMLIELEDYVDNSFVFLGDTIVGRKPGMKGFLKEHCPHIGYKSAMQCRTLALKSKEVETKENITEVCKKCTSSQALTKRFDSRLKVEHHRLRYRRHRTHFNASGNSRFSIASLREQARFVLGQFTPRQRKTYVQSLQKLVSRLAEL